MLDNPFRKPSEGLNPDDEAFLKEFGGLEDAGNTTILAPKIEEEVPADEAVGLGVTKEQREAYLNELVDIAPGYKIPRREYEAVVEIFRRINKDLDDEKKILIENEVGDEGSSERIQVKENHVIYLGLSKTPIQSLDGVILPEELKVLQLSETPIQSLAGIILPKGLGYLDLLRTSIQSYDGIKLPEGLDALNLAYTPIQSLDGVTLPEGLKVLYLWETPLSKNTQKKAELKAKYPNIEFQY